jgi:hypothetical protein
MLDGSGTAAVPSTSNAGRARGPLEDHGPMSLPIKLSVIVPVSAVEFFCYADSSLLRLDCCATTR